MKTLRHLLLGASLAIACGGGGTGTVTGTIDGTPFTVADVVSGSCNKLKASAPCDSSFLVLSTTGNVCGLTAGAPSSGRRIQIQLSAYDPSAKTAVAPSKPGTYPIAFSVGASTPLAAVAQLEDFSNGSCSPTEATDGQVVITKIGDNDAYEGTADLTFPTMGMDHVTIQFSSSGGCDAMNAHLGC